MVEAGALIIIGGLQVIEQLLRLLKDTFGKVQNMVNLYKLVWFSIGLDEHHSTTVQHSNSSSCTNFAGSPWGEEWLQDHPTGTQVAGHFQFHLCVPGRDAGNGIG